MCIRDSFGISHRPCSAENSDLLCASLSVTMDVCIIITNIMTVDVCISVTGHSHHGCMHHYHNHNDNGCMCASVLQSQSPWMYASLLQSLWPLLQSVTRSIHHSHSHNDHGCMHPYENKSPDPYIILTVIMAMDACILMKISHLGCVHHCCVTITFISTIVMCALLLQPQEPSMWCVHHHHRQSHNWCMHYYGHHGCVLVQNFKFWCNMPMDYVNGNHQLHHSSL